MTNENTDKKNQKVDDAVAEARSAMQELQKMIDNKELTDALTKRLLIIGELIIKESTGIKTDLINHAMDIRTDLYEMRSNSIENMHDIKLEFIEMNSAIANFHHKVRIQSRWLVAILMAILVFLILIFFR